MRSALVLALMLVAACDKPAAKPVETSSDGMNDMTRRAIAAAERGHMTDTEAVEAAMGPTYADGRVTAAKYTELSTGMTYPEVAKVMGSAGEESVSSSMPGVGTTQIYTWKNADGSNMSATFQNGSLMMKAQTGLP